MTSLVYGEEETYDVISIGEEETYGKKKHMTSLV